MYNWILIHGWILPLIVELLGIAAFCVLFFMPRE